MNLILLFAEDFAPDGTARLRGRRARHVAEVHRAAVGDSLVVGRLGGLVGRGEVLSASADEVVLAVSLDAPPPPPPGVDLILALPRPKVLRRLLGVISALGVGRLVLLNSYRVEKSYFDSPLLTPDALKEELCLGLEQAKDTRLPEVELAPRFRPFVEDEIARRWPDPTRRLLAHPAAPRPLEATGPLKEAVLAVGPEGGFIPFEVELLEASGFTSFSLGPRILRVDTAVPLLIGQLALWRRLSGGR
jgi:RsmE family RNA methyltransferase